MWWWHFSTELMYSIFPVCVCICLFCVELLSWTGWPLQISWTGWPKQIHSHVLSKIRLIHISITVLIHYETSSYVINKTRVINLSEAPDWHLTVIYPCFVICVLPNGVQELYCFLWSVVQFKFYCIISMNYVYLNQPLIDVFVYFYSPITRVKLIYNLSFFVARMKHVFQNMQLNYSWNIANLTLNNDHSLTECENKFHSTRW